MRSTFVRLSLLAGLLFALSACIKEPEGPAQRIGRSIDEISKSMRDIGGEWENERREQERAEALRREREREERYRRGSAYDYNYDREPIPERDPYYDTPPRDSYGDSEHRDDYRRERY